MQDVQVIALPSVKRENIGAVSLPAYTCRMLQASSLLSWCNLEPYQTRHQTHTTAGVSVVVSTSCGEGTVPGFVLLQIPQAQHGGADLENAAVLHDFDVAPSWEHAFAQPCRCRTSQCNGCCMQLIVPAATAHVQD